MINEMGEWEENEWRWSFNWRRRLFVWEEDLTEELLEALGQFCPKMGEDVWCWKPESEGNFSVRSTYGLLVKVQYGEVVITPSESSVFRNMWRSATPSKVRAFVWKVLLNRIPTRTSLVHRGVSVAGGVVDCPMCYDKEES
ncbi:hypothetical protein A2U01_0041963, partial [Trifolium medium]|nr:hypothetical protein [Trifolium medium]